MARHATLPASLTLLAPLAIVGACATPDSRDAPQARTPTAHDPGRSVHIPARADLVRTLRVAAVHDGEHIQIRYEFETDNPSWYHQVLVYENGEWTRMGGSPAGPDPSGLYEDRISMALDTGAVDDYDRYGGFVVSHAGIRSRTDEVPGDDAVVHPHIGERLGETDVRKFIVASRDDAADDDVWSRTRSPEELESLREQGVFLDTWQWRAHRSNPVGYADNGYVLDYRLSSEGIGMYNDNWDEDTGQPAWMFDADEAGIKALRFERLLERAYTQDDPYFLYEGNAVPFDPDAGWEEGDALPQRFLREPSGSRGAIRARGRYEDGAWRVRVTRTLESPNPLDSHVIEPGETYTVQFAVHTDASGARWHLVSLPVTLGIDTDATITATRAPDGIDLDDAPAAWTELAVFYPGQITWAEIEAGDPAFEARLDRALRRPTDHRAARELVDALVRHELRTLAGER